MPAVYSRVNPHPVDSVGRGSLRCINNQQGVPVNLAEQKSVRDVNGRYVKPAPPNPAFISFVDTLFLALPDILLKRLRERSQWLAVQIKQPGRILFMYSP